jgi:cell division protein FtsB
MDEQRQKKILLISAVVMAVLLFANNGFESLITQFFEVRRLQKNLVHLRAEHEALAKELLEIQQDPSYTEYLIRKNLKYVKKGEVEYRVMPVRASSSSQ